MSSLSDPGVQQGYVNSCLRLWKKWPTQPAAKRKKKLEKCINEVLLECDIPEVSMKKGGSPVFLPGEWDIRTPANLTDGAGVDYFVQVASLIYHEARHAEQFFRIGQGLYGGKLNLPESAGLDQKKPTFKDVLANCKIDSAALLLAECDADKYPLKMHAQIESWYQSIYGSGRTHRGEVLAHLDMDFYHNERPNLTFKKYLVLPEERDAYLMQDEVLMKLADELKPWPN